MRARPSSRLLVIDSENRLLLFKFEHKTGPLAGQAFWATPGGGVDAGESYAEAACRELLEEAGLRIDDPGPEIGHRQVKFQTPDGEMVEADERFFLIRSHTPEISTEHWTDLERAVMAEHRWWSSDELRSTDDQIWPEDLSVLLVKAGIWSAVTCDVGRRVR